MRRLIVTVAVFVIVAAGLLLAAALSLNRILAGNRDRILEQAEAAIGRKVAVDAITVSLWGGVGARLENVRIADDPQFGDADFVRATAITARARLWPLLRGRLEVRRIDAQQPEVHLIRDASGRWNYTTLKMLRSQASTARSTVAPTLMYVAVATTVAADPLPLLISRVSIADGMLVITDRSQSPPETTRVARIDLSVENVSLTTPVRFTCAAAVQSDAANVRLRGTVGPLDNRAAIPLTLDGSLGPLGPQHVRIDDVHLQAVASQESVQVSQLDGHAFDGSFTLSAQLPTRGDGAAGLKGELKDVAIAKLLEVTVKEPGKQVEGSGQLTLDLHATGNSGDAIQSSLSGRATADVHDGAIKGFNLPNEVLGGVTGIPGLGTLISAQVKPKYARLFSEPNTRFEKLHASFRIGGGRMQTNDLAIIATDYGVRANGWIAFDREADLSGTLLMSKQFSADVAADVKEAKYIVDDNGQLAVPFRLRGTLGRAKPEPDVGYLADVLTRAATRGGVEHLLDKLLGGKRRGQPPAGNETPRNPIEQGLRDLLGR